MDLEDEFTSKVMYVLNDRIVRALQNLPESVFVAVLGGKAINALLNRKYQTQSIDWDLNIFSTVPEYTNEQARNYVGRTIISYIKDLQDHYGFRLKVIEDYYDTKIKDIKYSVNPNPFVAVGGQKYTVGHINLVTDRFGQISIVDLVPVRPSNIDKFIEFDGVKYLGLAGVISNIETLLELKTYQKKEKAKKRLKNIRDAIKAGELSCNYYRVYYEEGVQKFRPRINKCVKDTLLGPLDPLSKVKRRYPRFSISANDISAHDAYFKSLPLKTRQALFGYTNDKSAKWNTQLNHNAFFPGEEKPLDKEIKLVQSAILNAPPLTEDTYVFMTNRYVFYPNLGYGNYNFKKNSKVGFYSFVSTTYDNYSNPYSFIDLFSPGVVYAIKIPKGSRVLILGMNSKYPYEAEVLFPYGVSVKINNVKSSQVTYRDRYNDNTLWYDDMITYEATFMPLIEPGSTPHLDISYVKDDQTFAKLLKTPGFAEQLYKIWLAGGLQ